MKILTLLGSPRKKGNTASVLDLFEGSMAKDHDITRVNVASRNVKGCLGCGACQKLNDEPGCVQKDDAHEIFEQMLSSDVVVYATPLYCWGFTSQMKALLDRHFCLVTGYGTPDCKSLVAGKPTALLVTCAGPIENNADLIQTIFDRMSDYTQSNGVGKYVVPFCTTPDSLGSEAEEAAKRMTQDLMRAML